MEMKKKSKKKAIIAGLSVALLLGIIVFSFYAAKDTKKREEMWAFRSNTLDETFFPLRDEIMSCIYGEGEEEFECNRSDMKKRIDEGQLIISSYDLTQEDTKVLRRKALKGITIIEDIVNSSAELAELDEKDEKIVKVSADIITQREDLLQNAKDINATLGKYYE